MIPAALREVFLSVGLRDQLDDLRRALAQPRPLLACGTVSEDGAAMVGRDGWLFLHGGNNQWNEQAAGHFRLTPAGVQVWGQLLQHRRNWLAVRGMRFSHLFVPEKVCVYPELHPAAAPPSAARPVLQLMDGAAPDLHYPVHALRSGKGLAPTYHRGNSHWTAYGAYLACLPLWAQLGIVPDDSAVPIFQRPIQQDLTVKFSGQPDENWHELDVTQLLVSTNEHEVSGHIGRFKHLHNAHAKNDCRVLFFGDSYAFDAHLAAWFALQCRDVFCAWQVGVQQPLIEQLAPDIVISEMAERFVTRLPTDLLG